MTSESGDTFEETSTSEELVVEASWEATVEVDDILWTHENISPCFAGNARGQHRGMSITRLVYDILFGQVRIQDVDRIKVVEFGGKLWTLTGNRRLWVFKTVKELSYLPKLYIPVCMVKMKLAAKTIKIMFNNRNGGRTVGFEIVSCTTTKKRRDLRHEPLVLTMDEKRIICGRKLCAAGENCVYHRRFLENMGNPCYRRHNHPEWRRAFRLVTERRRRFAQLPEEVQQAIKRREMKVEIEWRASFRHRKFEWKDSCKKSHQPPMGPEIEFGRTPIISRLPFGTRMVLKPQSSCCWSASVISDIKRARSRTVKSHSPQYHSVADLLPHHQEADLPQHDLDAALKRHTPEADLLRHRPEANLPHCPDAHIQRQQLLVVLREEISTLRTCLKSSHVQLRAINNLRRQQKKKNGSKLMSRYHVRSKHPSEDLPEDDAIVAIGSKVDNPRQLVAQPDQTKLEEFRNELVSLRKAAEELDCDIGLQHSTLQ